MSIDRKNAKINLSTSGQLHMSLTRETGACESVTGIHPSKDLCLVSETRQYVLEKGPTSWVVSPVMGIQAIRQG